MRTDSLPSGAAQSGAAPTSADDGFAALGLSPALRTAVRAAGYHEPTPIQVRAIPQVLAGRDVLGCARTGTGKTAAFALPILHQLGAERGAGSRQRRLRALVLAPTRELAAQIGASFRGYARGGALRTEVVFGGVGRRPQMDALRRGTDVLVATPGRLLDLMDAGAVRLGDVRHLVLDEADRMLDMGFIRDVRRIVASVPRERQTLLFSATLAGEIEKLAASLLRSPVRVAVDPVASTASPITESVTFVDARDKVSLLLRMLAGDDVDRSLVFTRTKRGADRLARKLAETRADVSAIHGDKSQGARERVLADLKRGRTRVLVATDVAARGIDVPGLSHVFNYDLPKDPESYVHRIGRTGRAGAVGAAFSFCTPEERPQLAAIERLTKRALATHEAPGGRRPARPAPPAAPPTARPSRDGRSRAGRGRGRARARRR